MQALRGALTATVAACAVLAPASLAAHQAPRSVTTQFTVSGEITKLGLARIAIGRVACTIPPKLEASAGRFVITDPVKMSCLNGRLRSVRYSPELATAQTSKAGYGNAPTTVPTPPAPTSATHPVSTVYSIGVLFLGGPPAGDSTTVTGTIDDLSATSVTVAGLTCSFLAIPPVPYGGPMVGDNVTLTCIAGKLIRMASVGAVTRS